MSTLYLVATPIGNLEDISLRAIRILRQVSLIAAEDQRQTAKLLSHYDIHTRTTSYHEHNKDSKLPIILGNLDQGDVALVSDAGTPILNDPGYELVKAASEAGHTVTPIPGASAPLAALIASGLPCDAFLYLGYLPRKRGERSSALTKVAALPYTLVFLEAPHRLLASLQDMQAVLGDRQAVVARELTKLHEEILRGRLSQLAAHFTAHEPRGEITLVVAGSSSQTGAGDESASGRWLESRLRQAIQARLVAGEPPTQIAAELSVEAGWPRRAVYSLVLNLQSKEI